MPVGEETSPDRWSSRLRRTLAAGLVAAAASAVLLPVPGTFAAGSGSPKIVFDKPPAAVKAGGTVKLGGFLLDPAGNPAPKNPVLVGVKDAKGIVVLGPPADDRRQGPLQHRDQGDAPDPDGYRLIATTISPSGDVDTTAEFLPWVPVTYPVTVTVGAVPADGGPVPLTIKTADCEGVPLQVQLRKGKDGTFETVEETTACAVGTAAVPLGNPGPGTYEVRVLRPRTSEMTTESTSKSAKLVVKATEMPPPA